MFVEPTGSAGRQRGPLACAHVRTAESVLGLPSCCCTGHVVGRADEQGLHRQFLPWGSDAYGLETLRGAYGLLR
ncbi:hypothetical protein NDU88_002127 [Pleurodeles waltl]|uniref:Uncharacterized protein n=1 Tax=Pleurodeles waltl TaxID=8319 RepID=A0AAV7RBV2_PLEWA|nr:hypothetical protein NDU88_002127 [Pleurodeles waltl]